MTSNTRTLRERLALLNDLCAELEADPSQHLQWLSARRERHEVANRLADLLTGVPS